MKNNNNSQSNDETVQARLDYLYEKYGQTFTAVEFIPAKRGFNDAMNKSTLVAKSPEGIVVNVWTYVSEQESFHDHYMDEYASYLAKDFVDYDAIQSLIAAKTYISLEPNVVEWEDLKDNVDALNKDTVLTMKCYIAVSELPDDEALAQLYEAYKQMQLNDFNRYRFIVAVTKDTEKTKNYVYNNDLYGSPTWDTYDSDVSKIVVIQDGGLSFDEFKLYFEKRR